MANNYSVVQNDFRESLKYWRCFRNMSQLDLALMADVSQRHVSWLETGRSQPSREMVLRLSEAMEVPLRNRNQILTSAGFANIFTEQALDEPTMSPVLNVLTEMLKHHEPYPVIVLDRVWNVIMKNKAADILFEITGDADELWRAVGDNGEHNIALLTLHPKGLRRFIKNWDVVGGSFLRRLKREALDSGDAKVLDKYDELEKLTGKLDKDVIPDSLLPVIPLEFSIPTENGEFSLSIFSVISTFGTAQDITTDELRIESFYPSNEQTDKFFSQ